MTLCEFAQQYGEFADLTKREEAGKPPTIIGIVGGYALRDAPSLNSVFFKDLPEVPEAVGFQTKKQSEAAFKEQGMVFLDVNYIRLFRNYIIACDDKQLDELQQDFDNRLRSTLNARALQHLFKCAFNYNEGEKCGGCELCEQAVITDSHVDSFRQMIDEIIVYALFDRKDYIDEKAIVLVLPVDSQIYSRCDKVVFLQDDPAVRQQFLNAFPESAKRDFIHFEGVMRTPFTIKINIEGKTTEEVVNSINELL